MALDAGSVYTILGGKFAPGGFETFDAANKKAVRSATEAEGQIAASQGRMAKAHERAGASAMKAAAANDALGASGKRLGGNLPLVAMDQWDKNNKKAADNLGKLGTIAGKTAAVGVVALAAATIYAASKATTFNQQMLKIQTQAGGTAAEVKTLSKAVLAMGGTVPQGPQKLAEGLYHIESAGFRGSQALEMLKASAEGAALGGASLENTTQAMIAATASQIKGVHGAADAMGQLNAIVGVGDMKMEQLAQAMATGLLPSAANAGLSLKDVGAALATVTDNATPANVTATRLRMTIALMASPSKAAAKQLATIGMSSTQMAHDLRQPNGLLKAVEDLKTHLRDSGLTAEQQFGVLSKVFGGGRSSAVIQTLIAETDRLKTKYAELGKADGVKKLSDSWAAFQKSEAAGFGELKSGAEAFAITVGNVLMPTLTKLSREGAHALDSFIQSGGAERVGHGILSVFETLGSAAGQLVGPLADVAHALISVGSALGLGNASELAALAAAFLTFKAATFVAPILMSVAGAIGTVATAAMTAPSIAAFAADLVAMISPVGLIAGALAVAAGAFILFGGSFSSSTSAAEANAAAMREDKKAIDDLHKATQKSAEATIAAKRATLEHKEAVEARKKVEAETRGPHARLKGADAENAVANVQLREAETAARMTQTTEAKTKALRAEQQQQQQTLATAQKTEAAAKQELDSAHRHARVLGDGSEQLKRHNELQANYNRAAEQTARIQTELAVTQESLNRQSAGQSAITAANAAGVAQLQNALASAHAPQKIVTRYELDDQGAQAKLGELASMLTQLGRKQVVTKVLTTAPSAAAAILALRAVMAGVPASKVVRILHNAPNAQSAMNALHGAINAVPGSKGVTINTNAAEARTRIAEVQAAVEGLPGVKNIAIAVTKTTTAVENVVKGALGKHASGRGAGPTETAVVGEGQGPEYVIDANTGKGTLVTSPTLMGLSPSDYVVPLEDQFRGRALGLFAMLARDLGIPGYKAGKGGKPAHPAKPGKHAPRYIPAHLDALSLPVDEIQSSTDHAKSVYDKAHGEVKTLDGKIASARHNLQFASPKGNARAKARAALNALLAQRPNAVAVERKDAQELKFAQRALRDAKAYQAKISKETDLANIAANDMRIADGRDDQAAYNSAKGRRLSALGILKSLIETAQKHVTVDSAYFRQLTQQIQTDTIEAQSTEGESFAEPPKSKEAEEEERTGMTAAERATDKRIERDIALAALTPDLADDKARAQELVSFLEGVLGEAQANPAARGGDEAIKSLADQVKTARSNLASLSGSGTNENADLQAQINQAKEREEIQKRRADIAEGALQVFGGSGDIGAGGINAARAAAAPSITINTLHPADPATLSAIGNAATAGIGLQGSRRAVRQKVGP